jgi:uncharacterized protein YecE (DUF72 family)
MYRSSYPEGFLGRLATRLRREAASRPVWCIFDNTARGAAIPNALQVLANLGASGGLRAPARRST